MTDSELPFGDQIDRAIGRVARSHVDVEMTLRWLWVGLMGRGLGGYIVNGHTFERLRTECLMLLAKLELPPDLLAVAQSVLGDLGVANRARNDAVHDFWVVLPSDDGGTPNLLALQSKKGALGAVPSHANAKTPERRDLAWLAAAAEQNMRGQQRLAALLQLLGPYLPLWAGAGLVLTDELRTACLEMARGEFDLSPEGGAVPWSYRDRPADS